MRAASSGLPEFDPSAPTHLFPSALQTEDNRRRYDLRDDVLIKTKAGATISAVVVRKKGVTTPQPVALTFTIYAAAGN